MSELQFSSGKRELLEKCVCWARKIVSSEENEFARWPFICTAETRRAQRGRVPTRTSAKLHNFTIRRKAAEDSRTPRRCRAIRSASTCRKVLECGCPLPLFYRFSAQPSTS